MLYESSARKPGSSPNKPVARPAQQAVKTQPAAMGPKKSQPMAGAGAGISKAAKTPSKQPAVKGWPSQQQGTAKSGKLAVAGYPHQKTTPKVHTATRPGHATVTRHATTKPGHTTVKGWPHHQPGIHKTHAAGVTGFPHHAKIHKGQATAKPAHPVATGWTRHHRGVQKPHAPGVTGYPHHSKIYKGYTTAKPGYTTVTGWANQPKTVYKKPVAAPTPQGKRYRDPQGRYYYYYPGTRRRYYYNGTAPGPMYVDLAGGQPPVQTTVYGTPGSPQPVSPVPAGCPPPQGYGPVPASPGITSTVPSAPPRQVCHTCGGTKGCITLSRFAFNSAQLKPRHQNQLRELAGRILNKNLTAVIATGHTDSSGSEDYNQELGEKRAHSVIRELKKQLSILKPNGHKHLFWQTDSKGETQPISKTNPANNRRVELCLKRQKI